MSRFDFAAGVRCELPTYFGASLAAERTAITPTGRGIGIASGILSGLAGEQLSPARENPR
ncbi:hypothetical protein ACVOMS_25200 [Bradyrhizobium guangxiense]